MKRISALLSPALALTLLSGCMQPQTADGPDAITATSVQDKDLLAGATSTTSWPQEDAFGRPRQVIGRADSALVLKFTDSLGAPVPMSGKAILYKAGTIPFFSAPESTSLPFSNTDSLEASSALIQKINPDGNDSVAFSILVQFETLHLECFITGFIYSTRLKHFLTSPYSADPKTSARVETRHYSVHGVPDSSLTDLAISIGGKSEMCFYISGSPFFFRFAADSDTAISIGPLPHGKFPVRVMRVTEIAGRTNQEKLEVYEVKVIDSRLDATHHTTYKVLTAGKMIFTTLLKDSHSIRSD